MATMGRPPTDVGEMIRDELRETQPLSVSQIRENVNKIRKKRGLANIRYHTLKRYLDKAVSIGILKVVGDPKDRGKHKGGVLPDADAMNMYRIVRGYTEDKRWGDLPSIVAGKKI